MSMDGTVSSSAVAYPAAEEKCEYCLAARGKPFCIMKHNSALGLNRLTEYVQLAFNPALYKKYENLLIKFKNSHAASGSLVQRFDVELCAVVDSDSVIDTTKSVCLKKFEINFSNFVKDISPTCITYLLHTTFDIINNSLSDKKYKLTSYEHQISTEYIFAFQRD